MQQHFSMRREFNQDFSLILVAVPATKGAALYQPIYEFDRAVVTKTKLLGKRCDGGTAVLRQSLDCQQNLVLLGLNTLGAGRFFAEVQELPDTVTELGKPPKAKF
jgi:hypothetical protein